MLYAFYIEVAMLFVSFIIFYFVDVKKGMKEADLFFSIWWVRSLHWS